MEASRPVRSERRARRTVYWWRRVLIALLSIVAIVLGLFGWRAYQFWSQPLNPELVGGVVPTIDASAKRFTVLMIGADDRPGEPGRSDTILVAFVDLTTDSVNLVSLPRDTYVQIPGHGWDKLNAAYAYGKTELTQKTVEGLIGIPIDFPMVVNMQGFEQIVDAVGGVDIQIAENMDYEDPSDNPPLYIHLKKGLQHLNGKRALQYVRFRHDSESDWGRMKRQQTFLKALAQAAKKPSNLLKVPQLLDSVKATVSTTLTGGQLSQIALAAKDKLSDHGITGATLTGDDIWTRDGYYLGIHFKEMRKTIRALALITPDAQMEAKDARDAAAYAAALPTGTADSSGWTGRTSTPASGGTTGPGADTGSTTKPNNGTSGVTQPSTGTSGAANPGRSTGGTSKPATGTGGTTQPGTGGTAQPGTGTAQPGTGTTQPGTGTTKPGTGTGGTPSPSTGTGGVTVPGTGAKP